MSTKSISTVDDVVRDLQTQIATAQIQLTTLESLRDRYAACGVTVTGIPLSSGPTCGTNGVQIQGGYGGSSKLPPCLSPPKEKKSKANRSKANRLADWFSKQLPRVALDIAEARKATGLDGSEHRSAISCAVDRFVKRGLLERVGHGKVWLSKPWPSVGPGASEKEIRYAEFRAEIATEKAATEKAKP